MLKYDTEKLDYNLYRKALGKWTKQKLVSPNTIPDSYKQIGLGYNGYDWLKRIGLYIVTILAVQSSIMFVLYFLVQGLNITFDGKPLLLTTALSGIILFTTLNRYINLNNVYKQGTDDAWLHSAIFATYFGLTQFVGIPLETNTGVLFAAIILCCITGFAAYQYADSFAFLIFILSLNSIPLYIVSMVSKELLFFSVLLVVPLNFLIVKTIHKWDTLHNHYWSTCFVIGRAAAYILMYLSINLYIIRSLAYELMGVEAIPLQPFFLTLTIVTPLIFIYLGIKQKLKYLLYCGLFLLLPTVATVRYYYSVMPIELACMIGGFLLIIGSYLVIRHLRQTESSYTFEPDPEEDVSDLETLMILQQFGKGHAQPAPGTTETQFGGGTFGGGGSGGGF